MAGGKSSGNAARSRKRVEATVLKRSRDGSAFTRCEACNKDVPVVLIDMHSCSVDKQIRMTLEAQVVEKTVEVAKAADRKKSAAKGQGGGGNKDAKRKRSPTAFFLFMNDFRKEFKAANPDNKSVATASKEAGEKWRSMTDEEKKPYIEKAAELKAQAENGEGSGENNVAKKKAKADDKDGDQEVDQPAKKRIRHKAHDEDEDDAGDQEDVDEQNELDDDLDDGM
ncbi:high mobility group B protein 7-like [Miscanthus floridulus]|uniref:high mobility group B protein 7-like n=1 Tax=Miscanthus floridulus TaxID=154761 RepID=UPI0034589C09